MIQNDIVIKTFNSISEASRETNIKNISMAIRGERKSAGGYKWEKDMNI
jgi:hypothetical protein